MQTPRKHLNTLPGLIALALSAALTARAQQALPPAENQPVQVPAMSVPSAAMPSPAMPLPPLPAGPAMPALPSPEAPPPAAPDPSAQTKPATERAIPETLAPSTRDPFWPIGFTPKSAAELEAMRPSATPGAPPSSPRWTEARESLRIGGSAKGPKGYTALVNNKLVNAGDLVTQLFEGKVYRWKVDSISAHSIAFAPLDWMPADGNNPNTGKDRP